MIGLPSGITACLFDLDGVLTSSAELHRAAWKETFDAFLAERNGDDFVAFTERDYAQYVDGRVRADGVRTFLTSRGITLPEGAPDDPPSFDSVAASHRSDFWSTDPCGPHRPMVAICRMLRPVRG